MFQNLNFDDNVRFANGTILIVFLQSIIKLILIK